MKKVAITTLGCKVNQYESASFASSFNEAGCEIVPFSSKADVYVINTCSVTGKAGQQSRQLIRRVAKVNPSARLVVTGCYAQMASQKILEITDNPLCIVGNGNKHLLVEAALSDSNSDLSMLMGNIGLKKEVSNLPVQRFSGRTRAYLRIQDGCNNFCSYCIVPYTRGRSRSVPEQEVLSQAAVFAEEGYREIVITGINVGKYGQDRPGSPPLISLLEGLCRNFPAVRFRLSSIELTEVGDPLLALLADQDNFMPHLHIPLQSGDDGILARMNRRYSVDDFAEVVNRIHNTLPSAAIGCDILCGFPGESESAYENTFNLLSGLPVTYLHVFPYSKRPGTLAATMSGQVPKPVKTLRVKQLRELSRSKKIQFYNKHVNTVQQVLIETRIRKNNLLQGFSENYISVQFEGPNRLKGEVVQVRCARLQDDRMFGIVEQS